MILRVAWFSTSNRLISAPSGKASSCSIRPRACLCMIGTNLSSLQGSPLNTASAAPCVFGWGSQRQCQSCRGAGVEHVNEACGCQAAWAHLQDASRECQISLLQCEENVSQKRCSRASEEERRPPGTHRAPQVIPAPSLQGGPPACANL